MQVPDNLPTLSDAKAIGLFRILQEALTNVMRHAQAHTVELTLAMVEGSDSAVRPSATTAWVSSSLKGVRYRFAWSVCASGCSTWAGDSSLHGELGAGTALSVTVPLDA